MLPRKQHGPVRVVSRSQLNTKGDLTMKSQHQFADYFCNFKSLGLVLSAYLGTLETFQQEFNHSDLIVTEGM